MTWNKMTKVLCPANGMRPTWANGTKPRSGEGDVGPGRCTVCGLTQHARSWPKELGREEA
jgi:hypothetical protein